MSAKTIPIFQSESDKANYERKTPLTKFLINELRQYRRLRELAWCATLDEFFDDELNRSFSLVADGFTPVLSNLKQAEEAYVMLARKEFSKLSTLRHTSLSESISSGSAKSIPVVAVSYKHMKCVAEDKEHLTISRRQFLDIFFRIYQFFEDSIFRSSSNPEERAEPPGVVLWLDRMLLVSNIPSSTTAWVDRGLAPYMKTMSFLSCVTRAETDFEHYDSNISEIDEFVEKGEGFRVGDVLSSLWIAVEFDLSYGATSIISSTDSLAWTNIMYSLPDIDSMDKGLQTQVRNMLARGRCSISISGFSFYEGMLQRDMRDTRKIRMLDDEGSRPIVFLGSPRKMLDDTASESFSQLREDLILCASLMPLIAGDHTFSRMAYLDDVMTMKNRWSQALERILAALDQPQREHQRRILIDLFAPREFDDRCKALDHMMDRDSLACLGYLHLLEETSHWKPYFTDSLTSLLSKSCIAEQRFVGVLHCGCFRHNVSPLQLSDRCVYISIDVFGSIVYPQRAVYHCLFYSCNGNESGVTTATVTGRCPRAFLMMFRELMTDTDERNNSLSNAYVTARELSSLLVLHGRVIRFLLDYGCQDSTMELCSDPSKWTYAQMLEGCRTFRTTLTELLLHALNKEVLHTDTCQAKKASLQISKKAVSGKDDTL